MGFESGCFRSADLEEPTHSLYHVASPARYNCCPTMRTKTALPILSGAAALFAAALFYTQRPAVSQTVAADDSVLSFRMRVGATDTAPRSWDGSLKDSAGGEPL